MITWQTALGTDFCRFGAPFWNRHRNIPKGNHHKSKPTENWLIIKPRDKQHRNKPKENRHINKPKENHHLHKPKGNRHTNKAKNNRDVNKPKDQQKWSAFGSLLGAMLVDVCLIFGGPGGTRMHFCKSFSLLVPSWGQDGNSNDLWSICGRCWLDFWSILDWCWTVFVVDVPWFLVYVS